MRRLHRLVLAPSAALALALALTGCGDTATTSADVLTPQAVFAQVAAKTQAAGTSRFVLTTNVEAEGETITIGGEGAFAADGSKGSLVFRVPSVGDVEVRVLDGQAYLKLPGQPGWLAAPLERLAGSAFGQSADPTSALDQLEAASSELKETGTETTRGEECTAYTGVFDYQKAAAAATGPAKAQLEKSLTGLKDTTVPFTALVDAQGRMRKFTQQLTLDIGGQSGEAALVLEFFDFGLEIDVEAPPAAEVTRDSPLLDQVLAG